MNWLMSITLRPVALVAVHAALAVVVISSRAEGQTSTAPASIDRDAALLARTHYLADFGALTTKLASLAAAIPEDKFQWRPNADVRSVSEVFQHVMSEHFNGVMVSFGVDRKLIASGPEAFRESQGPLGKADVIRQFAAAAEFVSQSIAGLDTTTIAQVRSLYGRQRTVIWSAVAMTGELHEHLGQLIAYARMIGVPPPWSQ